MEKCTNNSHEIQNETVLISRIAQFKTVRHNWQSWKLE